MTQPPNFEIDEDLHVILDGRKLAFLGDPTFLLIEEGAFEWLRKHYGFEAPIAFEVFLAVAVQNGVCRQGALQ
jgi:hypothetical protein